MEAIFSQVKKTTVHNNTLALHCFYHFNLLFKNFAYPYCDAWKNLNFISCVCNDNKVTYQCRGRTNSVFVCQYLGRLNGHDKLV